MPLADRITLAPFLVAECGALPDAAGLPELLLDLALACKGTAKAVAGGPLCDGLGVDDGTGLQGVLQQKFEQVGQDVFRRSTEICSTLAGAAGASIWAPDGAWRQGNYLLIYDPLDGALNIDVNVAVGSLFSVLRAPDGRGPIEEKDFLQAGHRQLAAGFALYGPSTVLVLTVGRGVHAFTLDPVQGDFVLTQPALAVPAESAEFAINASNSRFWEPPVKRYVEECMAGLSGPRDKDFSMRWVASLVADAHRILVRGGVYLSPRDHMGARKGGRHRLLYEANPISFLIEQAGGLATTGQIGPLDVEPVALDQRVPLIFGSRGEVERIVTYHHHGSSEEPDTPLFHSRGLFRTA